VSGVSAYYNYEICMVNDEPLTEIPFKETLMYQSREYVFCMKNTGVVRLSYAFECTEDAMVLLEENPYMPFSVSPGNGVIPPGKTAEIRVKFSPLNSGEFGALLSCSVANSDPSLKAPAIDLFGHSKRPFCHFDMPACDYVTAGRRDKTNKGPAGLPGQLDPSTRVFELVSCGVNVKQTGSFFVTNPTEHDYNFRWKTLSAETTTSNTDGSELQTGRSRAPRGPAYSAVAES